MTKVTSVLLVALVAFFQHTHAASLEKRNYVKCQTSGASPKASDCMAAVNEIPDAECYATNMYSSGCKTEFSNGSCKVAVCRNDGETSASIGGKALKAGLKKILDSCVSGGKVGGYFHYDMDPTDSPQCDQGGYHGYINVEFIS